MPRHSPIPLEVSAAQPPHSSSSSVCAQPQSNDEAWREHWVRQLRLARETQSRPLPAGLMGCEHLRRRQPLRRSARIEFVMWWGSASSYLRGTMMAERLSDALAATGVDNASVSAVSGFEFAQRATPVDYCICVKWCVDPAPQHCRRRGGVMIHDVLDNEDAWRRALRNESSADVHIVSSRTQQQMVAWAGSCAALIPHHHTNEFGIVHPDPSRPVRTVGVLASQDNFPPAALLDAARDACRQLGVELELRTAPSGVVTRLERASQLEADAGLTEQRRHHEALRGIDVALVWPREEASFYHAALRPSTRLVTWWSHGVPAVFYEHENYMALASAAAVPTHARDAARVSELLRLLIGGPALRRELAATQRHFALWFTPRAIAEQYVETFEALSMSHVSSGS